MAKNRMRWSRQKNEIGLSSCGQSERGYDLNSGGKNLAKVRPYMPKSGGSGYFWYGHSGEVYYNSLSGPNGVLETVEEAKAAAMRWIRERS